MNSVKALLLTTKSEFPLLDLFKTKMNPTKERLFFGVICFVFSWALLTSKTQVKTIEIEKVVFVEKPAPPAIINDFIVLHSYVITLMNI